jgi:hypothetical protein
MIIKSNLLPLLVLSLGTICVGHDNHDKDQMPLDYVRFPYQAMYPGDNSGQSVFTSRVRVRAQSFNKCFRTSHRRRNLLWYNDVCETAVGPVPHEGTARPIRHCVPRRSLRKSRIDSLPPRGARRADDLPLHRTPARRTGQEHVSDPPVYARDRAA